MLNTTKPKLQQGLVYVLKTSQFQDALSQYGIDVYVDLNYWVPQQLGSILEADYWLPNDNVPYPRVYVRAGALLKKDIQMAAEFMKRDALPEFAVWLRKIMDFPNNSPVLYQRLYFKATYDSGKVFIRHNFST